MLFRYRHDLTRSYHLKKVLTYLQKFMPMNPNN